MMESRTAATLLRAAVPSPIGTLVIVAREHGPVCALGFELDTTLRDLRSRFGEVTLRDAKDPAGAVTGLRRYLDGDIAALGTVEADPGGTPFQQEVWAALREIRPGTTVSYSELAAAIDRPAAVRAVGAANARNPIAIVIPCHRVVGADGRLTGYGGGLDRKRWLLRHEGARLL
jgi:methylated-DNA-[protein]-cysteine S-methyltransferase